MLIQGSTSSTNTQTIRTAGPCPTAQPYDHVICLACGLPVKKSMVGKGGHLAVKHDGMTVKAYRAAYPDAIIYSPSRLALEKARRKARPELGRARVKRWRKKNPKKANLNRRNWEAKNPDKVKAYKRRSAANYAPRRRALWEDRTPEEIEADKKRARELYARRYPNRSPEKIEKDRERNQAKYQVQQAKLAQADRILALYPLDWWDDSKRDWRLIGSELLSHDGYMSNEELADRLDAARVLRCPFCQEGVWGCITRKGQAANYISKVREWVNRPGKSSSRK
jgi:hypothetical protein